MVADKFTRSYINTLVFRHILCMNKDLDTRQCLAFLHTRPVEPYLNKAVCAGYRDMQFVLMGAV